MLADKSGLRLKSKKQAIKKEPSKYSETDVQEMNRQAGIKFLEQEEANGRLTDEERADLYRLKLKNGR